MVVALQVPIRARGPIIFSLPDRRAYALPHALVAFELTPSQIKMSGGFEDSRANSREILHETSVSCRLLNTLRPSRQTALALAAFIEKAGYRLWSSYRYSHHPYDGLFAV